jgi:hypothetical protein
VVYPLFGTTKIPGSNLLESNSMGDFVFVYFKLDRFQFIATIPTSKTSKWIMEKTKKSNFYSRNFLNTN